MRSVAGIQYLARATQQSCLYAVAKFSQTYADRLRHAGVPVELHMYPRAYLGFYRATNAHVTRQASQGAAMLPERIGPARFVISGARSPALFPRARPAVGLTGGRQAFVMQYVIKSKMRT